MRLALDAIWFLLKSLVMILALMTLLWAAAGVSKAFRKVETDQLTVEQIREGLREKVEQHDAASETLRVASNQLQEAQKKHEDLSANLKRVEHERDEEQAQLEKVISEDYIHAVDDWAADAESRNELFLSTCDTVSGWGRNQCSKWVLEKAKLHPVTSENAEFSDEQWVARATVALKELGEICDTPLHRRGVAGVSLGWTPQDWGGCKWNVTRAQRALTSVKAFLNAHAAYQASIKLLPEKSQIIDAETRRLSVLARRVKHQESEKKTASAALEQADRDVKEAELALEVAENNFWYKARVVRDKFWAATSPFAITAILMFIMMYAGRPLIYFTVAPIAGRLKRIELFPELASTTILSNSASEAESYTAALNATARVRADQRKQLVRLAPNEKLWVRPDFVVSSRDGGAQWIYGGWKHPFTSYAAGLKHMTVFDGATLPAGREISVAGTGEQFANAYIVRLDLENHPGFVVRPSHVVGFQGTGELRVRARWVFNLMALFRGQLRYWIVEGTGSIYFVGYGGAFPNALGAGQTEGDLSQEMNSGLEQLSDALVIAWDARLGLGVERNENWQHVALLRRDRMFESSLAGHGIYLTTNSVQSKDKDPVGRFLEAMLSTIGKILGI